MINLLNPSVKTFTHIIHIADCHIKLTKRHDEYREVFNRLYDEIRISPANTVVALLGDILHSKIDLSPECIQLASELFKTIADIRPLVLIPGNHDALIKNKNRLDSLSPIVDALNHPNLFYLKTSGLYGFGNILWNNMSVFDSVDKYIFGKDIPAVYRYQYQHVISLFHGPIDGASTETGYRFTNPEIMPQLFDDHDIALCGDIHLIQNIQDYSSDDNKPCIRYCGSLICQNHGEPLKGHGYSMWDLSNYSYTHTEINNDYGYFTIEVNKGQLITDLTGIPAKVRLRVKCYETIASEVKSVVAEIKKITRVVEVSYVRMDKQLHNGNIIPLCKGIVLADLTKVEYQDKLIIEFLNDKQMIVNPDKIADILKINQATNQLIKKDEFLRNLRWKPIKFTFSNMFAYGEDNVIDFSQMEGIYGIFGPNKSGKSSILSAIIFCLFDKFDRGYKGSIVLNSQKSSFNCKLEFEIDGVHYFIERNGTKGRTGNVKVDVEFWRMPSGINGPKEELHGTARRDTNEVIRDYVGTYEDFIHTAASFQHAKGHISFIDMGNSDRKDLLVQFIGLNVFDRLHEIANERNKELNTILKLHKDKNYYHDIIENQTALVNASDIYDRINIGVESLRKQMADVTQEIVNETANIIKLDADVPTNLAELEAKKIASEKIKIQKQTTLAGYNIALADKEKAVSKINEDLQTLEASNLIESYKTYKSLVEKISALDNKISIKKVEIKGRLDKVERLKTHEYDPNCKYCTNNSFVKDATKAKADLIQDKIESDALWSERETLHEQYVVVAWSDKAYDNYGKLLLERNKAKDELGTINRNINIITNDLGKIDTSIATTKHSIELYHRNEVSVEANAKVSAKIASYKDTNKRLDAEFQQQHRSLMEVSGRIGVYKKNIETLSTTLKEVQDYENESDSYQNYIAAVGRDGIPYQIISNTVPEIEKEVNSILTQVVDFTVEFETDGKNVVPYVVYEHGRWPIELTSGYERFVTSIAIRVALTEVSNLPKCSFLSIDEGMGTLDSEHLAMIPPLFNVLKHKYDFILVISHLDSIRDAVDKTIEISQDGNFSSVIFE